jgi:hypothetical protein
MHITHFFIEISIPLCIGLLLSAYLGPVTSRLLQDLCGTTERANFWVRITGVMLLALPLSAVLMFGRSGTPSFSSAEIARHALMLSTLGVIATLALLAKAIMKRVPDFSANAEHEERKP